ncbi:MAG: chemotaxis protein CheW, partial [Pseudomonadota bacterium]
MAIDVHHVAEVLEPLPLTPVPGACRAAPALTNVRGAVVPVIDLRRRLDLPTAESAPTRLIVLDLATADE